MRSSCRGSLRAQAENGDEHAIDDDRAIGRRGQRGAVDLDEGQQHAADDAAPDVAQPAENDDHERGYGVLEAAERRDRLGHAHQRPRKAGEAEAEAEDDQVDAIGIDADEGCSILLLDERAGRKTEPAVAKEQDAGSRRGDTDAQNDQPACLDANGSEFDDCVHVAVAPRIRAEGERHQVLHDDRQAEEDDHGVGFEPLGESGVREEAPQEELVENETKQGAERGRAEHRSKRADTKEDEAPVGDIAAQHHKVSMCDIEEPHRAVDQVQPECDQHVDG